jgi:ribosomal protein L33
MIKISSLLEGKIHPMNHGALISRIIESDDNKYFAAVSSYQRAKSVNDTNFDFDNYTKIYVQSLNSITGNNDWISKDDFDKSYIYCSFKGISKVKALYLIENDLKITKSNFFNRLYKKFFTDSDYIQSDSLDSQKRHFIRGFCELRGSIDTTYPKLSMDYFYENKFELNKARLLNEYLGIPYYIININFRQLQEQYVEGINKRNTQLRLELNWYSRNIGFINLYKCEIIRQNYNVDGIRESDNFFYLDMPLVEYKQSDLFIKRISLYSERLFDRKLTSHDIDKIRQELGFDIENDDKSSSKVKRNKEIVELVRLYTPDECAGCRNKYDINDRTFLHRKTGRPYFEIHHTISFNNNVELDHEDNLVKLCPVCHSCVKSGVGIPKDQSEIINNIFENMPNVKYFAEGFFDTNDKSLLVQEVYRNLK